MSDGNGSPKDSPPGYDEKFADFIGMCEYAKTNEVKAVVIAKPRVIGDNYEEVIESLFRLADAEYRGAVGSSHTDLFRNCVLTLIRSPPSRPPSRESRT